MRDGHIDSALGHYHPQFFRTTPASAWNAELEGVLRLLGPLKDYRLDAYAIQMSPDTAGQAMAQFAYTVAYQRDSSREFFVLTVSAEGKALIVAHRIGSDALLVDP